MTAPADVPALVARWRADAARLDRNSTAGGLDPGETHGMQCQAIAYRRAADDLEALTVAGQAPPGPGDPGASALVHAVIPGAVAAVRAVRGSAEGSFAAEDAIEAATHLRGELAAVRAERVRELRGTGRPPLRTWAEVGELIGVGAARAQQIADMPADRGAPRGPRSQR